MISVLKTKSILGYDTMLICLGETCYLHLHGTPNVKASVTRFLVAREISGSAVLCLFQNFKHNLYLDVEKLADYKIIKFRPVLLLDVHRILVQSAILKRSD